MINSSGSDRERPDHLPAQDQADGIPTAYSGRGPISADSPTRSSGEKPLEADDERSLLARQVEENGRLHGHIRCLEREMEALRKSVVGRSPEQLGGLFGKGAATGRRRRNGEHYDSISGDRQEAERSRGVANREDDDEGVGDLEAPPVMPSVSQSAAFKSKMKKNFLPYPASPGSPNRKEKVSDDELDSEDDTLLNRDACHICDDAGEGGFDGRMTFREVVKDRASWLVGLLALQSCSSFILARNEKLLEQHLVIVQFLTMLVGAGGNAGNQAAVRVIRGLAVGKLHDGTVKKYLWTELKMGVCLSMILGIAGFARAAVFMVPAAETVAITTSLFIIVSSSILTGALLPLGMHKMGLDAQHSSTTIQVLMDILGVTTTVVVSGLILNTGIGDGITAMFGGISETVEESLAETSEGIAVDGQ